MKIDTSDYNFSAILSIITPDYEVHLVVFHFHTFNPTKFNYDTYDKELLTIFEVFQI